MRSSALCLALVIASGCAEPTEVELSIHFEGAGTGRVTVRGRTVEEPTQSCVTDCTVRLPRDGKSRLVVADEVSIDTRFSCVGCGRLGDGDYTTGPHNDDFDLTVRFTTAAEAPLELAVSGAYTSSGDLVVGTAMLVARVSPDGAIRWTRELRSSVRVDPNDNITVDGPQGLMRLDQNNVLLWTADVEVVSFDVLPDGDVIVRSQTSLQRLNGVNGTVKWSAPSPSGLGFQDPMAVSSDTIYLAAPFTAPDGSTHGRIHRISTLDGTETVSPWIVPGDANYEMSIAVDHEEALLVRTNHLLRFAAGSGGAPLFDIEEAPSAGPPRLFTGVVATAANQALHWQSLTTAVKVSYYYILNGTSIAAADTAGGETWRSVVPPGEYVARNIVRSATCHAGTCVLFGGNSMKATFIEVP